MKPAAVVLACALLLPSRAYAKAPRPPKIVVTVVVDQLAAWIVDDRRALLPTDGGFARLAREGSYVREMDYAHAITETAPGHASLYTGAPPRDNGIVCNERLLPGGTAASPKHRPALIDDAAHRVSRAGIAGEAAASLVDLRAETLADHLLRERPDAHVVALSLKDRGSIFAGGHHPTASIWYDTEHDDLMSSTAVEQALPAWALAAFDRTRALRPTTWERAVPAGKLPSVVTDDRPGEASLPGGTHVFPHAIDGPNAVRASPAGDRLVVDLALAAIADAGAAPTLLALSLSSNDYVSHVYGSDSLEAFEELFALDRALADFMRALDKRYGADGWALLLTADHGSTPLPDTPAAARGWCGDGASQDRWGRPCSGGHRVSQPGLGAALEQAVEAAFGRKDLLLGVADPYVYLSEAARTDASIRAPLLAALERVVRATPGVAEVFDTAALPAHCPPISDDSLAALVCRSTSPADAPPRARSGELYIVLDPPSFFSGAETRFGGSHGTPYRFNRAVPLFVRAPGHIAAGVVVDTPVPFSTFVRTAAQLLGIAPPSAALPGGKLPPPR
jgi:arylsulfatase A-like enzyme